LDSETQSRIACYPQAIATFLGRVFGQVCHEAGATLKLITSLNRLPDELRGGAVTIGNFDGVHQGHRAIVEAVEQKADEIGGPAIVFTFDPHPARLLRPEQSPPPLTWIDRKADLLAELGVDVVVAYPTDLRLLELSYEEFFRDVVLERLGAKAIVEGPNFFFGRNREGTTERLGELCRAHAIQFQIVVPAEDSQGLISSSRIRDSIRRGDVDLARTMLTQPYRIRGLVVHGDARGHQLGFPTANLDGIDTLVPGPGVYAGRARIEHRWHWAAIHVGPSPTFQQGQHRVEVHVLNFEGSLYGQPLEVEFISQLRQTMTFPDAAPLKAQMELDVRATHEMARRFSAEGR
jgi:riboflavin kinase/FMN adenylyltransferase